MKVAKIKNNNKKQVEIENEQYSLKNMLIIIITLLVIFGIFYFITTLIVKEPNNEENAPVVLDSSKITINQLLNRNNDEYYVIATKESLYESSYMQTNYVELYNNYINSYKQKENSLEFYYIDLDDALNKNYLSDKVNISNNLSELKLNDEVLFKIKGNKIEESYIGKEEIIGKLSSL